MTGKILIVEDDPFQRAVLSDMVVSVGFVPLLAEDGQVALHQLNEHADEIELILTDLNMPRLNGKQLIEQVRMLYEDVPIIVLTSSEDVSDIVEVIQLGARDFIVKPPEPTRLHLSIRQALQSKRLQQEVQKYQKQASGNLSFNDLIGRDGGLREAVQLAHKVAPTELPVLIYGESGVGKELFAQAMHDASKRSHRPFVAVNCAAIPENLVESILFGHKKGAFTGAVADNIGKFKEASKGTIFLDEIGELPLQTQAKLLRVLQEQEIDPVGGGKPEKVDVRIISATNRNLAQRVQEGLFREDLFFRLKVLMVTVPPLRERPEDVAVLAEYFLRRMAATEQMEDKQLSPDALEWAKHYEWPGNVRELENLLSAAFFISDGQVLDAELLQTLVERDQPVKSLQEEGKISAHHLSLLRSDGTLKRMERISDEVIDYAMQLFDGNVTKAAHALDMGRSTLFKKLKAREE